MLNAQNLVFESINSVPELSLRNFAIDSNTIFIASNTVPHKILLNEYKSSNAWDILSDEIGFSRISSSPNGTIIIHGNDDYKFQDGVLTPIFDEDLSANFFRESIFVQNDSVLIYFDKKYFLSINQGNNFIEVF